MPEPITPPTRCPKCDGPMEPGALVGNTVSPAQAGIFVQGTPSALRWWKVEAREERGLLSGKPHTGLALVLPEGGALIVLHYHCSTCGYLEAFATTPNRI